jgi:hypothetical protein
MERLFRRHFWVFHAVFLTITAWSLGATTTTAAGHYLRAELDAQPKPKAPARAPVQNERRSFDQANTANIFEAKREIIDDAGGALFCRTDADCEAPYKCIAVEGGPETIGQKQCQIPEQLGDPDFANAQRSGLPLKLVGTSVFRIPEDSLASLIDESGGKSVESLLYSVNPCSAPTLDDADAGVDAPMSFLPEPVPCRDLPGGHKLVRIDVDRVYLMNIETNRYEYIGLAEEVAAAGKIARAPKIEDAPTPPASGGEEDSIAAGITKTGANSFEVTQTAVNEALGNLSKLATQARIVPAFEGGQAVGFKLFSIRPGSLYSKIGIQNGDIIQKVNGYEISSPDKALEVYQKLKDGKAFSVDIKRRGKPVTLEYGITP